MRNSVLFYAIFFNFFIVGCIGNPNFNEQIIHDVKSKLSEGYCLDMHEGSEVKNIIISEMVPIGESGLVDVNLEFDVQSDGTTEHHKKEFLYSIRSGQFRLEAITGCE